ncbi:MAG: type II toxin-antitoxin system VapC family toxin [Deltaproteobacteria bacterium]|nr:type II toxin-antitoxin system VapC family toxin [Deltaproteobacteria bacterium]
MKVLFDTSVLVAAMVAAHPAHHRAAPWLRRAKGGDLGFLVAVHTLAELYAVLTRLPTTPRISPAAALRLVEENIASRATIITFDAADYRSLLRRLADLAVAGGAVYDGLIARAAEKAAAERLLTLNVEHFRRVWPEGAELVTAP